MDPTKDRPPIEPIEIDNDEDDDEASIETLREQFKRNAVTLSTFASDRVLRGDDPSAMLLLCIDADDETWTDYFEEVTNVPLVRQSPAPTYVNTLATPEFVVDLCDAFDGFKEEFEDALLDGTVRAVMLGAYGRLLVCQVPLVTA